MIEKSSGLVVSKTWGRVNLINQYLICELNGVKIKKELKEQHLLHPHPPPKKKQTNKQTNKQQQLQKSKTITKLNINERNKEIQKAKGRSF